MSEALRDKVAEHFRARPLVWIDGISLEPIGGKYAWRSRVSDCRLELGMDIRNRQTHFKEGGKRWTVSEYCYFPEVEAAPEPEPSGHDMNQPVEWRLF